jgi:hypothetical protein
MDSRINYSENVPHVHLWSSGLRCRVVQHVRTDVSEEDTASIWLYSEDEGVTLVPT